MLNYNSKINFVSLAADPLSDIILANQISEMNFFFFGGKDMPRNSKIKTWRKTANSTI